MYCIAELTFEFNKASDNILTFPRILVQSTAVNTLDKKHGLPVHRFYHAALAPKRQNGAKTALGLCYGDCQFLPNANCGKKNFESGSKRGESVGFLETRYFFYFGLVAPAHWGIDKWMHRLICAFVVRIWHKQVFS